MDKIDSSKEYTVSPIFSTFFAIYANSYLLVYLAIIFSPLLLFVFWKEILLHPEPVKLGFYLASAYITLVFLVIQLEGLPSRSYLKSSLLNALKKKNIRLDNPGEYHFIDLFPPDKKSHAMDSAYAVAFLKTGTEADQIAGPKHSLQIVSDVLQLNLVKKHLVSLNQVIFKDANIVRLIYRTDDSDKKHQLLFGDRNYLSSFKRKKLNNILYRKVAGAFDLEPEDFDFETLKTFSPKDSLEEEKESNPNLHIFESEVPVFKTTIRCDENGIKHSGFIFDKWFVNWLDILEFSKEDYMVKIVTNDKEYTFSIYGNLKGVAPVINQKLESIYQDLAQQDELAFTYPDYIYKESRKTFFVGLAALILMILLFSIFTPRQLMEFWLTLFSIEILNVFSLLVLYLPFMILNIIYKMFFNNPGSYLTMRKYRKLKLLKDKLQFISSDNTIKEFDLDNIVMLKIKKKKHIIYTNSGEKFVVYNNFGRLDLMTNLLPQRCERLRIQ